MKQTVIIIFVVVFCALRVTRSQDTADDVELLPAFAERESRRVRLFWSVMYEVCRTFCVWKTFCDRFCSLFNPTKERNLDDVDSIETFIVGHSAASQTQWLYDGVTQICEGDGTCVKQCINMEVEDDDDVPWPDDEMPENLFVALYELAKKYFSRCAELNGKTLPAENLLSIDSFCTQISMGQILWKANCVSSMS